MKGPHIDNFTLEQAFRIGESGWWKGKTAHEIALVQLFVDRKIMPFGLFREALETVVGHPVADALLIQAYDGLALAVLQGRPRPTYEEVLAIIEADLPPELRPN